MECCEVADMGNIYGGNDYGCAESYKQSSN